MRLSQLAAKPQLIEIILDDADTIEEYGESVTFFTWDRQPLTVFMEVAMAVEGKQSGVFEVVKKLILDETGKAILNDDVTLPQKVLTRAMKKVVVLLGN